MTHRDDSLLDKVKDALGFGTDDADADDRAIDMEHPASDDAAPDAVDSVGAAAPAARQGMAGGLGASGAMGGAGATGSAGVPEYDTDDAEAMVDPGDVKTEYEMGHEPVIPEHERVAESGVSRDPEDRVQP